MALKNINKAIIVCLFAATISIVYGEPPEALVGASIARDNEFPYLVSIRLDNYLYCGGGIIGPYHVLTAGHCVVPLLNKKPGEVTIVTGTNNLYYGGQTYEPILYVPHPKYNETKVWINDIAVIKVSKPFQFNYRTKAISLPTGPPPNNTNAMIAAWGATQTYPRIASPLLRKLNLRILPRKECQSHFSDITIEPTQICTLVHRNVGTCSGDSGSPLAYNNQIIGVVSGGIPCARGKPDIFTNVYDFLDFIKNATDL